MTKPTLTQRVMKAAEFDERPELFQQMIAQTSTTDNNAHQISHVAAKEENVRLRPLIEVLAKCALALEVELENQGDRKQSYEALSVLEKMLEELEKANNN